ncbi:hypothetical protein CASFOL_013745 [Castilleja foliolosa]|uniref:Uncharacterized protein n=1 Tax=Castilleja foliolosa TaxID=1961234 RepID=A0ABD3DKV6_9LAMI
MVVRTALRSACGGGFELRSTRSQSDLTIVQGRGLFDYIWWFECGYGWKLVGDLIDCRLVLADLALV